MILLEAVMSHAVHLILSAGTRVVTRNDAHRIGGGAIVPAGGVALITESPTDAQHRLLLSGISALREGELRVRLNEHREALLAIKRGDEPWPEVNAWRLRLHKEFDDAFASTGLPALPDYAWVNGFLLKARKEMMQ